MTAEVSDCREVPRVGIVGKRDAPLYLTASVGVRDRRGLHCASAGCGTPCLTVRAPTVIPMTHILCLDLATGALAVRRRDPHPRERSASGLVRVCPSPRLTRAGLTALTDDHEDALGRVVASAAHDTATGWRWDEDALDALTTDVEAVLDSPHGLRCYERVEDWTATLLADVAERGITAATTDADLAAMARDDLDDLRESAEVPGALLIDAPGLLRGYRAHRDALIAAMPAPVDAIPPPPVAPAETAPAPVGAVSADAARLHALAASPGLWPEASAALRVLAAPATATWAASHLTDDGTMDWLALRLDAALQPAPVQRAFAVALSLLSPVETIGLRALRGTLDPAAATALTDYLTASNTQG